MTKTYNWTTPRGAAIQATISVEHITRETISADGWPVEVSCDRWQRTVDSMTVNGQPTELKELYTEGNTQCILIKYVGFQSTHPARGATAKLHKNFLKFFINFLKEEKYRGSNSIRTHANRIG